MASGRIYVVALMALVVVGAVLVSGCGGGEDTADATETLTKAEFIEQGEVICKEVVKQREQAINKFGEENGFSLQAANKKQLEELVTEVALPTLHQQTEKFRALGAPKGDEAQVDEIIVGWESATKEVEENPGLATEGDPFDEADAQARAYGFKFCGLK